MSGELGRRTSSRTPNVEVVPWLLDGDPAVRWQAMRDLDGASTRAIAAERRRVGREGWGRALLAKQDREGTWGGGLYTPKWTSTTYTMLLLRDLGLPSDDGNAKRACALLLDRGLQQDGGIQYGGRKGTSETCITGMVLSILGHFQYDDARIDAIAEHLFQQQMPDGGWNCRRPRGATHSSVNTTISVLEGLRLYERFGGKRSQAARAAQRRGREFLLAHRLFRSHRTGAVINPVFLRLSFPPRWHYDILRALDYFQSAGAPRDERLSEAIGVLCTKRRDDGRWSLENDYRGKTYFNMERVGKPSRWNTLRALRVLRWWQGRK